VEEDLDLPWTEVRVDEFLDDFVNALCKARMLTVCDASEELEHAGEGETGEAGGFVAFCLAVDAVTLDERGGVRAALLGFEEEQLGLPQPGQKRLLAGALGEGDGAGFYGLDQALPGQKGVEWYELEKALCCKSHDPRC